LHWPREGLKKYELCREAAKPDERGKAHTQGLMTTASGPIASGLAYSELP